MPASTSRGMQRGARGRAQGHSGPHLQKSSAIGSRSSLPSVPISRRLVGPPVPSLHHPRLRDPVIAPGCRGAPAAPFRKRQWMPNRKVQHVRSPTGWPRRPPAATSWSAARHDGIKGGFWRSPHQPPAVPASPIDESPRASIHRRRSSERRGANPCRESFPDTRSIGRGPLRLSRRRSFARIIEAGVSVDSRERLAGQEETCGPSEKKEGNRPPGIGTGAKGNRRSWRAAPRSRGHWRGIAGCRLAGGTRPAAASKPGRKARSESPVGKPSRKAQSESLVGQRDLGRSGRCSARAAMIAASSP